MELTKVLIALSALLLGLALMRALKSTKASPEQSDRVDTNFVGSQDESLKEYMANEGIMHWITLQEKAGVASNTLNLVRNGEADKIPTDEIEAIAKALDTDVASLMRDFSDRST